MVLHENGLDMCFSLRSAPEEHHVYSLTSHFLCAPAERHVLWRVPLHAAPNGAGDIRNLGL
jgi:hypothetical protein